MMQKYHGAVADLAPESCTSFFKQIPNSVNKMVYEVQDWATSRVLSIVELHILSNANHYPTSEPSVAQ